MNSSVQRESASAPEIQTAFEEANKLLTSMEKHCDDIAVKLSELKRLLGVYERRIKMKERVECLRKALHTEKD